MNQETNDVRELILAEYEKGKIVLNTCDGLVTATLTDCIQQSTDSLLYDLNRIETVVTPSLHDPKWVNDYAVAKVIRALKAENERLKAELAKYTWRKIESEKDLPDGEHLFTTENKYAERRLHFGTADRIWSGQKAIAYLPNPEPMGGKNRLITPSRLKEALKKSVRPADVAAHFGLSETLFHQRVRSFADTRKMWDDREAVPFED